MNEEIRQASSIPTLLQQKAMLLSPKQLYGESGSMVLDLPVQAINPPVKALREWKQGARIAALPMAAYPLDKDVEPYIERINKLELFATFSSCAGHWERMRNGRKRRRNQPNVVFGTVLPPWFMSTVVIPKATFYAERATVPLLTFEIRYATMERWILYRAVDTDSYSYSFRVVGEYLCNALEWTEEMLKERLWVSSRDELVEREEE